MRLQMPIKTAASSRLFPRTRVPAASDRPQQILAEILCALSKLIDVEEAWYGSQRHSWFVLDAPTSISGQKLRSHRSRADYTLFAQQGFPRDVKIPFSKKWSHLSAHVGLLATEMQPFVPVRLLVGETIPWAVKFIGLSESGDICGDLLTRGSTEARLCLFLPLRCLARLRRRLRPVRRRRQRQRRRRWSCIARRVSVRSPTGWTAV